MKISRAVGVVSLSCLSLSVGCGGNEGTDAAGDAGLDAGADATTGDAGTDVGAPDGACVFPAPVVAGSPETDLLADAPEQCGQAAHVWLRDSSLGEILEYGPTMGYTTVGLTTLATLAGVDLPRPPEYDVTLRVITYQTQDRGVLLPATAAVAWPEGLPEGTIPDVVLLLHGTMGFTDGCSASTDAGTRLVAAIFASQGFVVVVPDYIGLASSGSTGFPHPYLVGQATAIASLDAVRAAGAMDLAQRGDVCFAPRFATWGGSQGGHAAFWVDRLAPYYAPELTPVGGVAAVPPTDLVRHAERALGSWNSASGFFVAVAGATPPWYGVTMLDGILVPPWDVDVPAALVAECSPGDAIDLSGLVPGDVFQPALITAAAAGTLESVDPFGCMIAENGLTTTSVARLPTPDPAYGLLVILGEVDDTVDPAIERPAFDTLCAAGMPLQYLECAGLGHGAAAGYSLSEALDFMDDRFAGIPMDPTLLCTRGPAVTCSGTP